MGQAVECEIAISPSLVNFSRACEFPPVRGIHELLIPVVALESLIETLLFVGRVNVDFVFGDSISEDLVSVVALAGSVNGVFVVDPGEEHNVGLNQFEKEAILLENVDGFIGIGQRFVEIHAERIRFDLRHCGQSVKVTLSFGVVSCFEAP